jgi:hypothetical protein
VRVRIDQSTFQAGELDPLAAGRHDAKTYYQGGALLRNVTPLVTGGVRQRPGTRVLRKLGVTTGSRLVEFIFADDQAYFFAFQNATVDIFDLNGVWLMQLAGCPWTAAQLPKLGFAQRGDTLVVTHKDMPMQTIKRTGPVTFTTQLFAFDISSVPATLGTILQPYRKYADPAVLLTPAAASGVNVTLTQTGTGAGLGVNAFTAAHVGTKIRISGTEWLVTVLNGGNQVLGTSTIGAVSTGTTATANWDEQVFSAVRGWARCTAFHEDRLWFGGVRDFVQGVYASKTGVVNVYNFDVGTALDTDAIWSGIGNENSAEIRAMVSFRNLLFLCDSGEFYVPTAINKPITPTSIAFRRQSKYGSASVRPQPFDGAVAFAQKTGSAIRELQYSELEQAYSAFSVSTVASHLMVNPADMAVLSGTPTRPEQLLFVVMGNGSIAVLHSNRAEQFTGWFPWITPNGAFRSICNVLDQIFVTVDRTINGVASTWLEVFDPACFLDFTTRLTGVASKTWAGFGNIAGEVNAWAMSGNYSLGGLSVDAGGNVVLPSPVAVLDIGYNFVPTIKPMPLQTQDRQGMVTNRPKRVLRATLVVNDTLGFSVNGVPFIFRNAGDDLSLPLVGLTGRFDIRLLGWDRQGQPLITRPEPGPFTLLGFELESMA